LNDSVDNPNIACLKSTKRKKRKKKEKETNKPQRWKSSFGPQTVPRTVKLTFLRFDEASHLVMLQDIHVNYNHNTSGQATMDRVQSLN